MALIATYHRLLTLLLLSLFLSIPALARQTPVNLSSRRAPTVVTTMAVYQSYDEDGPNIDQLSFPFSLTLPLGSAINLALTASQTSVSGDVAESLSGLSDTQATLNYSRPLGRASLVASLGLNLPSGTRELTSEEFQTLILISQTAYDFRVPSLGQGFGASPAVALAVPVSDNMVLGLGAAYRVRGGFKPIEGLSDDYTPGNELLITLGLDTRLGDQTSLSLDATHTLYAADKLGDDEVLEAGSKTTLAGLVRHVSGFNEIHVLVLYRARAKSSQIGAAGLATSAVQTVPNEIMLQGMYSLRLNTRLRTSFLAEIRSFDATPFYPSREVFDFGIIPSFRLSEETTLLARFIYTSGSISGMEAGIGLNVSL